MRSVFVAKGARPLTFWASATRTSQPDRSRVSWTKRAPVIDSITPRSARGGGRGDRRVLAGHRRRAAPRRRRGAFRLLRERCSRGGGGKGRVQRATWKWASLVVFGDKA